MRRKTVKTVWEVWSYEVWGNRVDGYEVNNRFCEHRNYELTLPVTVYNPDSPSQFDGAFPSDKQIRKALGCKRIRLDLQGDDIHIYAEASSDGYPLGEMFCTSHDSLSPIRSK